jgi:hypothetical protein
MKYTHGDSRRYNTTAMTTTTKGFDYRHSRFFEEIPLDSAKRNDALQICSLCGHLPSFQQQPSIKGGS